MKYHGGKGGDAQPMRRHRHKSALTIHFSERKAGDDFIATDWFQEWLLDLKDRIRAAQTRAVAAANRELVLLYTNPNP